MSDKEDIKEIYKNTHSRMVTELELLAEPDMAAKLTYTFPIYAHLFELLSNLKCMAVTLSETEPKGRGLFN